VFVPVVLRRFLNAKEAATLLVQSIGNNTRTAEIASEDSSFPVEESGNMVITEGGETLDRMKVSIWAKEIIRLELGLGLGLALT
jgi:hypothetical protein